MDQQLSLGRWIRRQRRSRDWTQAMLAEQVCCSVDMIRKLEADTRRPSAAFAQRLAACLGLAPAECARFAALARTAPCVGESTMAHQPQPLPPTNLACPLTSFVGRQQELATLHAQLAASRLVSLTGMGGVGKTRLAHEYGRRQLAAYPAGCWAVDLAAITDPAHIPPPAFAAMGCQNIGDPPEAPWHAKAERTQRCLVILDHCEHLGRAGAEFAHALLAAYPQLQILATSREPLRLGEETVVRLAPLGLPDAAPPFPADELMHYDAIQLFSERALLHTGTFKLTAANGPQVIELCRQLDGLPLALEFAAARLRALPLEHLLERLDQRFALLTNGSRTAAARHQTLEAVVDWSYRRLSVAEQRLFRRLGTMAGGWSLDTLRTLCAKDGWDEAELEPCLQRLIEQSLVITDDAGTTPQYRLLETLRLYAHQRWAEWRDLETLSSQPLPAQPQRLAAVPAALPA